MCSANGSHSEVRELAAQLYRDKRAHLLRVANRNAANAANAADAEEAVNDAFASFLRAFDPDGEAPALPWITTTLKRECWRKRRAAHLDRSIGQEAERGGAAPGAVIEAIPSGASGPEQLLARVDEARRRLATLKPDERTALGLQATGYSYREIGAGKEWTHTKVNRAISEGRASLRELV